MNRITIKHNCIGTTTYEKAINKSQYDIKGCNLTEVFNKLGQLEDIEEELGIELNVLFKALKEGFWIKSSCYNLSPEELERFKYKNSKYYDKKYDLIFCPGVKADTNNILHEHAALSITLLDDQIIYFLSMSFGYALIKDYCKTWALTKEELE